MQKKGEEYVSRRELDALAEKLENSISDVRKDMVMFVGAALAGGRAWTDAAGRNCMEAVAEAAAVAEEQDDSVMAEMVSLWG